MNNNASLVDQDAEINGSENYPTIAVVGNPNVGKTSVFNRLTNLFAKTSNFAGTTVERREAILECGAASDGGSSTNIVGSKKIRLRLVDLPGLYSLDAQSPDEILAKSFLDGANESAPDGILLIVDATTLERSLFIAGQALQFRRPTLVAVNMIELARAQGARIDVSKLEAKLGCKVIAISARTGEGFDELRSSLGTLLTSQSLNVLAEAPCDSCNTCPYAHGHRWAATLARESMRAGRLASGKFADRADHLLTHRLLGPVVFASIMLAVFALVFWVAQVPMELLDGAFGRLSEFVASRLPAGDISSLCTDGIIGGVGGVLVFLPQIYILFFAIAILEDSGYLARAVVVVDRWMKKVGLPGQAFVPLLAAHAVRRSVALGVEAQVGLYVLTRPCRGPLRCRRPCRSRRSGCSENPALWGNLSRHARSPASRPS